MMRRRPLALLVCLALLGMLPGLASAVLLIPVDQHQDSTTTSINSSSKIAQTFTSGKTGQLKRIDLYLRRPNANATTGIYLDAKTPGGTQVGYLTGTVTTTESWVAFYPSSTINVTAGAVYAIRFNLSAISLTAWGGSGYSGGHAWIEQATWVAEASPSDFAFRTYVAVAAPTPTPVHTPKPTARPKPKATHTPAVAPTPNASLSLQPAEAPTPTSTPTSAPTAAVIATSTGSLRSSPQPAGSAGRAGSGGTARPGDPGGPAAPLIIGVAVVGTGILGAALLFRRRRGPNQVQPQQP